MDSQPATRRAFVPPLRPVPPGPHPPGRRPGRLRDWAGDLPVRGASVRGPLRPGPGGDPGRGQLPGPGVPGGRRHAALHDRRLRPAALRRRRPGVRGPGLLVGADDPRARASRGGAGDRVRGRPRHQLRHADLGRGRARRGDRLPGAAGRAGPAGQQRHRGHDVRGPARPRGDRPGDGGEVRRLLPRPRRLAARRRRLRGRHPRPPGHPRRDRGAGRRDARPAVQRRRGRRGRVRGARRPDRLRGRRGGGGEHGRRPAAATASTPSSAGSPPSTARCSSSTR